MDRIENCLDKIHKSGENPQLLIDALKKILEKFDNYDEDFAA